MGADGGGDGKEGLDILVHRIAAARVIRAAHVVARFVLQPPFHHLDAVLAEVFDVVDQRVAKVLEETRGVALVNRIVFEIRPETPQPVGRVVAADIGVVRFPKRRGRPVFEGNALDAGGLDHLRQLGHLLRPAALEKLAVRIGAAPVETTGEAAIAETLEHFLREALALGGSQVMRHAGEGFRQAAVARGDRVRLDFKPDATDGLPEIGGLDGIASLRCGRHLAGRALRRVLQVIREGRGDEANGQENNM